MTTRPAAAGGGGRGPRARGPRHALRPRPRGRRGVAAAAPGPGHGPGRRERLGQVHRRAAASCACWSRPAARCASTAPTSPTCPAARCGRTARDVSIVFQDPAGSLDPRMLVGDVVGGAAAAAARHGCRGATGEARVAEELGRVGPARRGRPPLPARALRRPAPAGQHRPGADVRTRAAGRRRADQRPGRVGAGLGAQPARRPAARHRLRLPVHHPRPVRGGVPRRRHRGDVPRPARRAGLPRAGVRAARAPLHAGAAGRGPGRRPAAAARPAGRSCSATTCRRPSTRRRDAGSTPGARSPSTAAPRRCPRCGTSATARPRATWCSPTAPDPTSAPPTTRGAPHDLHDPADAAGHLRHGVLDALDRVAVGHAHAGARRQRVRRRGHRRLRPARRRAAPQRPRRRGAGHLRDRGGPGAPRAVPARGRRRPARPSSTSRSLGSTWCPAPGRSPPPSPAPSTPGCCCCATTAPCRWRDVLEPAIGYAARRAPAARAGSAPPSRPCGSCSRSDWPTSAELWLADGQAPGAGRAVHQPGVRRAPCERLVEEGRAAGARPGGADRRAPGAPGARASSPRRSTRSRRRPFRDSSGEAARRPGHRRRPGRVLGDLGGAGHPRLARLLGRQDRPWGQGPVLLQTLAVLDALDDPAALRPVDGARHPRASPRRSSSPSPTGRPGTATAPTCPLKTLLSPAYAAERRRADRRARLAGSCGPGARTGASRGCPAYVRTRRRRAAAPGGRRRRGSRRWQPDGVTRGDTCHVDVVDRWGNMVSATPSGGWLQSSPDDPGAGLPPRQPAADVLAGGGAGRPRWRPGRRPRTTLTPTLVHRDGAAGAGLRHPRRRPAGPVAAAVPAAAPRSAASRLQEAIDAPMWHTHQLPGLVLPARHRAGRAGGRGPGRRRRASTELRGARPRRAARPGPGRSGGCARSAATRRPACSPPGRTRAGCRATPPGADGRPCPACRSARRARVRARGALARRRASSGGRPVGRRAGSVHVGAGRGLGRVGVARPRWRRPGGCARPRSAAPGARRRCRNTQCTCR